jgi:hypothetical protein
MKKKNRPITHTSCNRNRLTSSSLKCKEIFADFNGGKLASDVGLLASDCGAIESRAVGVMLMAPFHAWSGSVRWGRVPKWPCRAFGFLVA